MTVMIQGFECAICLQLGIGGRVIPPPRLTSVNGTVVCGDHVGLLTDAALKAAVAVAREDIDAVRR